MGNRWQNWLVQTIKQPTLCYQYYATVHSGTCETCLANHGKIFSRLQGAPQLPLHPDCRCTLLEFPKQEFRWHEMLASRMREKAQLELRRRQLFLAARDALDCSLVEALSLFQQSAHIETYLEEIDALCHERADTLSASPELSRKLRELFLKAYRYKFDSEKYLPLAEGMKASQLAHGLRVIQELFWAYTTQEKGV